MISDPHAIRRLSSRITRVCVLFSNSGCSPLSIRRRVQPDSGRPGGADAPPYLPGQSQHVILGSSELHLSAPSRQHSQSIFVMSDHHCLLSIYLSPFQINTLNTLLYKGKQPWSAMSYKNSVSQTPSLVTRTNRTPNAQCIHKSKIIHAVYHHNLDIVEQPRNNWEDAWLSVVGLPPVACTMSFSEEGVSWIQGVLGVAPSARIFNNSLAFLSQTTVFFLYNV